MILIAIELKMCVQNFWSYVKVEQGLVAGEDGVGLGTSVWADGREMLI